jgi:hypothetical protein
MKYLKLLIAMTLLLVLMHGFPCAVRAEDTTQNVSWIEKFHLTFPQETNATGFVKPTNGSIYAGLAHTWSRIKHDDIKIASLDFDATVATAVSKQEDEADTLYGVGAKVNFHINEARPDKAGFEFLPNIGVTFMTPQLKGIKDMWEGHQTFIYGTLLTYRWFSLVGD